jgi:hypothetical protein
MHRQRSSIAAHAGLAAAPARRPASSGAKSTSERTLFAPKERPRGMRGLLCAEFLDFAGSRFGTVPGPEAEPSCDPATCPGPGHVQAWADLVAHGSGIPAERLLELFGTALFGRLVRGYPSFLVGIESTLDLVARYDSLVVAEVRKLDAAAKPPELGLVRTTSCAAEVTYRSSQGLADLAEGLLRGSIAHFGEALDVERGPAQDATCVAFRLVDRGPSPTDDRLCAEPSTATFASVKKTESVKGRSKAIRAHARLGRSSADPVCDDADTLSAARVTARPNRLLVSKR